MPAREQWHIYRLNHSVPARFLRDITRTAMHTHTQALNPLRQELQKWVKFGKQGVLIDPEWLQISTVTYFLCLPPAGHVTVLIEWQHILKVALSTTMTTQILIGSNVCLFFFPLQDHIYYQEKKASRYDINILGDLFYILKLYIVAGVTPWPLTLRQKSINYNEDD